MKVLFVARGKKNDEPGIVVQNQAKSLVRYSAIELHYFIIKGSGILSYFLHVPKLFWKLRTNKFDVIHANYSFCGFTAWMACSRSLVVSLMGSDAQTGKFLGYMTKLFTKKLWNKTIVKSQGMAEKLGVEDIVAVIPNGVDFEIFPTLSQLQAQEILGLDTSKRHVIFIGDPNRYSKNGELAMEAIRILNDADVEFHVLNGIPHSKIAQYLVACNVLLMTSRYEGSPNAIKEGLACNKPIVSTNVGDVAWLLEGVDGCYTTGQNAAEIAEKLRLALIFDSEKGATTGRQRLVTMGLDAESTAHKINNIYKNIAGI